MPLKPCVFLPKRRTIVSACKSHLGNPGYKRHVRPLLPGCRVYHHTPEQDVRRAGAWVVLEYVGADLAAATVGVFRLADSPVKEYRFVSRGLDMSRRYRVTFDSAGRSAVFSGAQLCTDGLPLRVAAPLMSELLVIQQA